MAIHCNDVVEAIIYSGIPVKKKKRKEDVSVLVNNICIKNYILHYVLHLVKNLLCMIRHGLMVREFTGSSPSTERDFR